MDERSDARQRLAALRTSASSYFERAANALVRLQLGGTGSGVWADNDYWSALPEEMNEEAGALAQEVARLGWDIANAARRAPLLTEVDVRAVGYAVKGMRAALRFRDFEYSEPDVVHGDDDVAYALPGSESQLPATPSSSRRIFERWAKTLDERLALIGAEQLAGNREPETARVTRPIAAGYRPGTAFVMMWISPDRPELVDVNNTVKRCFERFEINAVRADEIEHEDVITARILDEIKTAEFLFADLTGERPSVYYEVGYAHALGRRVIMFRRRATPIHFDLAAYNCPEYENLSELEDKLTNRLISVTGKNPALRRV